MKKITIILSVIVIMIVIGITYWNFTGASNQSQQSPQIQSVNTFTTLPPIPNGMHSTLPPPHLPTPTARITTIRPEVTMTVETIPTTITPTTQVTRRNQIRPVHTQKPQIGVVDMNINSRGYINNRSTGEYTNITK
jgi:hypothetical protein